MKHVTLWIAPLEVWRVIESLMMWPGARGVLKETLPPLKAEAIGDL
ncbi:MAG: hypothetical protein WC058_09180 [Phycisphaeraceae bacterium]